jgi:hypothetical protein
LIEPSSDVTVIVPQAFGKMMKVIWPFAALANGVSNKPETTNRVTTSGTALFLNLIRIKLSNAT